MNRLLKFRVWDKNNKVWLKDWVGINNLGVVYDDGHGPEDLSLHDNAIIQQFTGLTDKNNKEIYEGDVCKVKERGYINDNYKIGEIIWNNYSDSEYVKDLECWIFKEYHNTPLSCIVNSCGVRFGRGLETEQNTIEIIGNIFESPDLLKV